MVATTSPPAIHLIKNITIKLHFTETYDIINMLSKPDNFSQQAGVLRSKKVG